MMYEHNRNEGSSLESPEVRGQPDGEALLVPTHSQGRVNDGGAICHICQKCFSGRGGLAQHQRQKHEKWYHQDKLKRSQSDKSRRWTFAEKYLLAKQEAKLRIERENKMTDDSFSLLTSLTDNPFGLHRKIRPLYLVEKKHLAARWRMPEKRAMLAAELDKLRKSAYSHLSFSTD